MLFLRLTCAGAEVGVGPKIEEKKRPSAVIKAILSTVNSKQTYREVPQWHSILY